MKNSNLIEPTKITSILDKDYQFIDLRTSTDFNKMHLKNFINIPYNQMSLKHLDKTKRIILLCYSGAISSTLANKLLLQGYKAYSVKDGYNGILYPSDISLY